MKQETSSLATVDSNLPKYQIDRAVNFTNNISDALQILANKLEPLWVGNGIDDHTNAKAQERSRQSELVESLLDLNERLYNLQYQLEQLPNFIQL